MSRYSHIFRKIILDLVQCDLMWKYIKGPEDAPKGRKTRQLPSGKWQYETIPRTKKDPKDPPKEKPKKSTPKEERIDVPPQSLHQVIPLPYKFGEITAIYESESGTAMKGYDSPSGKFLVNANDAKWNYYWKNPEGKVVKLFRDWVTGPKSIPYNIEQRDKSSRFSGVTISAENNLANFLGIMSSPTDKKSIPGEPVNPSVILEKTEDLFYPLRGDTKMPDWVQTSDTESICPLLERLYSPNGTVFREVKGSSVIVRKVSNKKYQLLIKDEEGEEVIKESMKAKAQGELQYLGRANLTPDILDLLQKRQKAKDKKKAERKSLPRVIKDRSSLLFKSSKEGVEYIKSHFKTFIRDESGAAPESLNVVALFLADAEKILGKALPGGIAFGGPRGNVVAHYDHSTKCIHVKKGATWADDSEARHKRSYDDHIAKEGLPHNVDMTCNGVMWHEFGHQFDRIICNNAIANYVQIQRIGGLLPFGEKFTKEEWDNLRQLSKYSRKNDNETIAECFCAIMTKSERVKLIPNTLRNLIIMRMEAEGYNMKEYK